MKKVATICSVALVFAMSAAPAFASVERYDHNHGQAADAAQPVTLYLPAAAEGDGNSAHGNFAP